MVNITLEKQSKITSTDINNLLAFAMEQSETDGFLNRFVFERAMYLYLYLLLCDESEKDGIRSVLTSEGVLVAWQSLVADGKVDSLLANHETEVQLVQDAGDAVFADYKSYSESFRGAFCNVQERASSNMEKVASQMAAIMDSDKYQDVLAIADKWGANNTTSVNTSA